MKVIIAGSRTIEDYQLVEKAITDSGFEITEVVSGAANGVDRLGLRWAYEHEIQMKFFYPDWVKHGKFAGPIRNAEMADYADALILVWDGQSKGSKNMLKTARKKGLKVYPVDISKITYV